MKITAIQLDIQWLDAPTNCQRAEQLMDAAPADTDLFVLPEMWATGFITTPTLHTAELSVMALRWMKHQAKAHNAAIAGSLPVRQWPEAEVAETPAMWRNRFCFVEPNGICHTYDKRNLFTYGGEQLTFSPGSERVIIDYQGIRFMPQVCFDLRFPETSRNVLSSPYDVLLYVANWPSSRRSAWDVLLTARAIENQAYCLGVNRTGADPQCFYNGGTAAIDPYGLPLFRFDEREQIATFCVDKECLQHLRQKFQVLK